MKLTIETTTSELLSLLPKAKDLLRSAVEEAIGSRLDQILRNGELMTELEQQLTEAVLEVKQATDDLAVEQLDQAGRLDKIISDLEKNPSSGVVTESIATLKAESTQIRATADALKAFHAVVPAEPPVVVEPPAPTDPVPATDAPPSDAPPSDPAPVV